MLQLQLNCSWSSRQAVCQGHDYFVTLGYDSILEEGGY